MHRPLLLSAVALVAAAGIAGCGSSGGSSSTATTAAASAPAKTATAATTALAGGAAATVATGTSPLGTILVNGRARTLYLFEADKGTSSTCTGACAAAWPPLLTRGAPKTTGSARSAKVGTTKRADGTTQVTYAGHPLYTFVKDTASGMTSGEDSDAFGAGWYVLSPSGAKIEPKEETTSTPKTTTSTSTGASGGY
jgi:predicted lipoprotein with Yx(FWY)xxD motif